MIARRTPLRPQSDKRRREERQYTHLRRNFLNSNPYCQFPGCTEVASCVHHRRGRSGARLLDTTWWAASCLDHNEYAETQTGEALAIGWLVRIESVDPEPELRGGVA